MTKIESFSFIISVFISICVQNHFTKITIVLCFSIFSTSGPVAGFSIMAPRKMSKAVVESSGHGLDVVSDTSSWSINVVKTWSYISNILQSESVSCSDDSSDNKNDDLSAKYKIVAQAEMHKIAARPQLLPYFDMIRWALNHVDIPTKMIISE
jgi:hypothetical protein